MKTFKEVAEEWAEEQIKNISPEHKDDYIAFSMLGRSVYYYEGERISEGEFYKIRGKE